jgi:6-phosphogluconolactonase
VSSEPIIKVLEDPARETAQRMAEVADAGGHIVLTGGSTPKRAYEMATQLGADWSEAHVWFGDERCVPPDDERSNFRMAKAALLDDIDPAPAGVHRIPADLGPEAGAHAYAADIAATFGPDDVPRFDLLLLGMGPDTHTASLFPGKPELDVIDRWVTGVAEAGLQPFVPRVSLTFSAINAARAVVFLISGAEKAEGVARVFGPTPDPTSPATRVRPTEGTLTVLLDPAAAAQLPGAGR